MQMIELTINGKKVKAPPESTILDAARKSGIYIPHLCYDRRLVPYGGCRLCLVEVEGSSKLLTSCSTPVRDGMVVQTETEKLAKARKSVLELLLVHHPLDCPVCDKAGECELQDLAFKYGAAEGRFKRQRSHGPDYLDAPLVVRDPNRCVLCGICVRLCTEYQGVGAINLIGRGFKTMVSPAFGETLDCEFCGQCIDACPVGALSSKPIRYGTRVWMMEHKETICPYCGCGCTLTLGVREGRVERSVGKEGKGISNGDLCGKGRFGFDFIYSKQRLTTPMIRRNGELEPVGWEEALAFTAEKLSRIKETHGPGSIGAIGSESAPKTVEDSYMLQKFMRETVGTGNIDSAARFGYAKAQGAVKQAFGLDALPIDFHSPLESEAILVVESDISSSHPVFALRILEAAREKGAKLMVMEPRMTKLSRHAHEWLRNRPGSSVAVLNAMMNTMLDEGLYDKGASNVRNFAELQKGLADSTPEKAEALTGVPAERIKEAARDFAKAGRRLLCLTMGESENSKGANTVLAAANLLILAGSGPEALQIPAEFSNSMGMFEAGVRPDADGGLDAMAMIYDDGSPIKAMYIMGEDLLTAFPRTSEVEARLKGLEFLVVQDIRLTETAKLADVVLPAASWAEKEGTCVGATGIPQRAVKCVPATGESLPDWKIFIELAKLMGKGLGVEDMAGVRAEVERNVKLRFETSGAAPAFNPVAYGDGETTDADYPMSMVTGVLLQHSGSLTTFSNSLCSVVSDAYIQVNVDDASRMKLSDDAFVKLSSRRGEVFLKARVTDEVPEGMIFAPAHFPHARVNALTSPSTNGGHSIVAVRVESAG